MPESILQIVWPFGGLSETLAFSEQEPGTAREYQNVRGLDCSTGRLRGSKRNGLSKYCPSPLKTAGVKVQDLIMFFEDNRQVTYTAIAAGSETITWDDPTPSHGVCRNVKTDRQGNLYALDGNSAIVKKSADQAQIWLISLPIKDENHVVRGLAVDDEDKVYASVSAGGLQEKAKIWCYEQLPDDKFEILFEIEPKCYVEDLVIFQGRLYTIQNETDRKRSWVRVYDQIQGVSPHLAQEWRVPHPVNSIAIKKDGSLITAHEPAGDTTTFYWRDPDPFVPNFSVDSIDWTPYQLTDFSKRVWCWLVADDIDTSDVAGDLEDGVEVLRWRDRTKRMRHLYAALDDEDGGPHLVTDALCGHKSVRFTNGSAQPYQVLKSARNASLTKESADQQNTILPAYTDSGFAVYIVCRPSQTSEEGGQLIRTLIGQDRDNAQSGSDDHIILMNSTDTNTINLPGTDLTGSIYWFTGETLTSGGDGTAGMIRPGAFDVKPGTATTNPGNFAIITLINDGKRTGDSSGQVSLFQVNGNPIDSFQSRESFTLEPTFLGLMRSQNGAIQGSASGYLGEVFEIFALDVKSRTDLTQKILTYDDLQYNSPSQSQTVNENTLILGYLAHEYGAQLNLPRGTAAPNNYPHPFGVTGTSPDQVAAPPNQAGTGVSTAQGLANKRFGAVIKYSPEGKIQWCANEMASGDGSRPGGFGYAVAVNSDGNIYSIGPDPTIAGGVQQIRMIVDQGTSFSISTVDGAWSTALPSNADYDYKYPKVDVDEFDNFYLPFHASALGAGSNATFRVYSKTGTLLHGKLLSSPQLGYAVAVDRRIPNYRNDLTTKTVEHLFVGGTPAEADADAIAKVKLVSSSQSGDSPRDLRTLGVSGGDIVQFSPSGVTSITGGSGALDSDAYVQSTALFKRAFWTDGRQLKQYDPVENTITTYKSTSAGAAPDRCSLIEAWRGRIVQARSADEPHNWFMSKKDNPDNWDYFPPVPDETTAVAGNNTETGLCPDIINSVVPYSEDILLFGGDHTIWGLIGDPAAGGRLELVTDATGMSFGRPWCKDPNGVLYFFGSTGGIFRWAPGARPERVSVNKIERQLQDVDLSTHYIRLVYNHKDEGIHILQVPFGDGGTQVSHWFLELKTQAFALDHFGSSSVTNVQPTAVTILDGDAFDDRTVLFGGEDGYVRQWDRAAKSDDFEEDGTTPVPIDALVTIGPLNVGSPEGVDMTFDGLTVVLGEQDDGARYELFASETADSIGDVVRTGELRSGRNPPRWDRVTGPFCWLRLRNTAPDERFTYERAFIRASVAGMTRARSS